MNVLYNPVHSFILSNYFEKNKFPVYFCWLYLFIYTFVCLPIYSSIHNSISILPLELEENGFADFFKDWTLTKENSMACKNEVVDKLKIQKGATKIHQNA